MNKIKDILGDETKRSILFLVISAIALASSFFHLNYKINSAWLAILLCGVPIMKEAVEGLVTRFDIKADVLVSIALIASVIIGETFAAGEIALIMQIGSLLEELTVEKARAGIEKLVHLTPRTARIVVEGKEKIVEANQVELEDILRVNPGETIPVDGIIMKGQTSIDQSVMTGESVPVDKEVGDEVRSGTVNRFGSFDMKATQVGEDTSLQRMIRLVASADAGKAKIVSLADRWATWIVVIALTAASFTWFFTDEIIRAVTILVVFCPCALVLATPTAIIAAIGNASRHGVLVKEGDALERLAKIDCIVFDKTGTLTEGKPKVIKVISVLQEFTVEEIYKLAATIEARSEHPLGKAIVSSYNNTGKELSESENFSMMPGRGVSAKIGEKTIAVGNLEMMEEAGIDINDSIKDQFSDYLNDGATPIYLAINHTLAGIILLSDTLRPEVAYTMKQLEKLSVTPVLLTGDNKNAASHIAKQAHIKEYKSNCLPEDKMDYILNKQKNNQRVCMVGDGINDAPSLKASYVGIAMGGCGSDIAVDAADMALVRDDINSIPYIISLSKHMLKTIKLNLIFSMGLNFVAIILAIAGILNPILGALVHNAGSVLVIINSAFLLKWKTNL